MAQFLVDEEGNKTDVTPTPKKRRTKKTPPARRASTAVVKGPKTGFNWESIYREFVEGIAEGPGPEDRTFPTLKALAERHGPAYVTIRERAAAERWTEKKEQYQAQVAFDRQKERSKRLAKNAGEFDEKSYKVGDIGINLVMMRLAEIAQEAQAKKPVRDAAMQNLANGVPIDDKDLRSAIWSREIEGLANAAERFQNIGMKSLGTDVQRHTLSGPGGGPIEVDGVVAPTINIGQEIMRDDPERVAALIKSFGDAGLIPQGMIKEIGQSAFEQPDDDEDIQDAEIVEDDE